MRRAKSRFYSATTIVMAMHTGIFSNGRYRRASRCGGNYDVGLLTKFGLLLFCRSPWSSIYVPLLEDGVQPSKDLRKMEVEANDVFSIYRDQ